MIQIKNGRKKFHTKEKFGKYSINVLKKLSKYKKIVHFNEKIQAEQNE